MKNSHKSPLSLIVLVLSSVMLAGCQQPESNMSESTFDASSDVESASYLIGFRQAQNIQQQGGEIIDMQAYGQGARDANCWPRFASAFGERRGAYERAVGSADAAKGGIE